MEERQGSAPRVAGALHLVAPAIARKLDVRVKIGGLLAATDGRTIILPALPADDSKARTLGFGHLFHEANHVRETDVTARPGDPFVGALWNVLEDNRSDGLGLQLYPGARLDRARLLQLLHEEGRLMCPQEGDRPDKVLLQYVFWRLQHEYLRIDGAHRFARDAEALAKKTFPQRALTQLDSLMWEVPQCADAHAVARLAERIAEVLKQEAEEPMLAVPPDQSQGTEQQGAEQQGANPGCSSQDDARDKEAQQRAALRAVLGAAVPESIDLGEATKSALEEHASANLGSLISVAECDAAGSSPDTGDWEGAKAFELDVQAASNALLYRIGGLLQAATQTRRIYQASGGRIDRRRLAGTAVGNFDVFERRIRGLSTDTAVMVLVDRSASMALHPMKVAREAAFALCLALERVADVQVGAAAFPGMDGGASVSRLLAFGERCTQARVRFATLSSVGGTPMAEAMMWAGRELLALNRPRRLLLVVTDADYASERGRHIVRLLGGVGVECAGVGIGVKSVAHIFQKSRVLASVDELPGAMFSLLLEMMKGAHA